ncbi:hypothetical protein [Hymenobacter volaticus]|uniref:DUF2490 domain-containing protein n=1 Tax=Hymenobacter volaticus TaxID=2932254 RepID=A0ABY4G7Z5_9BACT|nr:hypothetical protein [Hymenobacter volaticus]UOQ67003.1 hypothetical protein MUN86_03595 [Hymenobacter volaticus]
MLQLLLRSSFVPLLLLLALSSCSVYAPMLPAAPQIRDKGQVEVQGTSFLNGRWEAGATYSPVKHLLVRAAGGIKTDDRDTTYFRIRQYEVGVGGYYPLGERWLLSGLGGYGQARSSRGYFDVGPFVSPGEDVAFRARYHKLYGEASASYRAPWVTMGIAYRLTRVTFSSLIYDNQPFDLRHMTRMEPMLFWRFGREDGAVPWLRVQTSIGGSSEGRHKYDPNESYECSLIKDGRGFVAVSVILLPHLFVQKSE